MPKVCEFCGKQVTFGKRIVRHGLAKKKGGIGLHTTGITPRTFRPNLQKIRIRDGGGVRRAIVCTRCLKSGKVQKA
jgi:large subunit ribosomal protein L28